MTVARCKADGGCGWSQPAADPDAALRALDDHFDVEHLGRQREVVQMPSVTWRSEALAGIRTLCLTGRPFVVSEVIELGVPDAPNPRTDWPSVTNEARDMGWMKPTGQLGHSVRPATKGSPCTEWIGMAAVRGAVA